MRSIIHIKYKCKNFLLDCASFQVFVYHKLHSTETFHFESNSLAQYISWINLLNVNSYK